MPNHTADISTNAWRLLKSEVKASGLVEVQGDRFDAVTLCGSLEQWGALADASLATRATHSGSNRGSITRSLRGNPAVRSLVSIGSGYIDWTWRR